MHRRTYIATLGTGAVAATAGCSGVLSGGGSSGSSTPRITGIAAVTSWEQPGDIDTNAVEEISINGVSEGIFSIAYRYDLDVGGGEVEVRSDVTLYHEIEGRIGERQRTDQHLTSESGVSGFVWATPFSVDTLTPGEITAEVYLRDEQAGETAEPGEATFTAVR